MTDDNRNANHSGGQVRQGQDPLLELTRLFNLDFNANGNKPATSAQSHSSDDHPQSGGPDDADLSFLESSPQPQSPQNDLSAPDNSASVPQNIDDNLDFLPNDVEQQPISQRPEPELPFNELYDLPSFTPRARSSAAPVETPAGFENEQPNTSSAVPMGNEPFFSGGEQSQHYNSGQNQRLPDDFNFIPEQSQPTPLSQNVDSSFSASPSPQRDIPTQSDSSYSTVSSPVMQQHASSDITSSSVQGKAETQPQYSAFDEMQFDSELEKLLVNAPLEDDIETGASSHSNSIDTDVLAQHNPSRYADNEANLVNQSPVFNPALHDSNSASQSNTNLAAREPRNANVGYAQHTRNNAEPLPYTPPVNHQTTEDNDFLNADHSGEDHNFFTGQQTENISGTNQAAQPVTKPLEDNTVDPFGLEDLSAEENVIVNPPVYSNNSGGNFQANAFNASDDYSATLPIEGQEIKQQAQSDTAFQQEYSQVPPQAQMEQPISTEYNNKDNAYETSPGGEVTDGQNGHDQNVDLPPDVNTFKFADEIVETTEPVDVPEIPYPAEETVQKGDALENEYADVFSVGNNQQTTNKLAEQDDFFADAYAQSGYNLKQKQSENNAAEPQYQSDDSYNTYENNEQNVSTENMTLADVPSRRKTRSLARKLTMGGIALFIVVGGGYAATKYFMPSQENAASTVIHADNEPFKVPAEQQNTNTDTQNNQEVYNHANGADDAEKNNQDKLVDHSETPEDLTALNETPEGAESYADPSNVEDAIAAASNQTVPTREVQSVIVNPDGTISPSKSSHADAATNNADAQNRTSQEANATQTAPNKPSTNAKTRSEENSSTTNSELEKIINDDAQNHEENKNSSVETASNTQNSMNGINSVKTPTVKQQAQPVQTAEVASQSPLNLASKTAPSETAAPQAKNDRSSPMASVGAGGYYVQIASQPTRESAVESLNKAKSSFGSFIGSLPLSIEPTAIPGKGTYYRVRVQVGPRDNAISLCERIKSKNGNCFVGK